MTEPVRFPNEYEAALLADLKAFIEHVEELDVLLAELVLRNGKDVHILDEDFENLSKVTFRQAIRQYEKLCRQARAKWNLPREL